MNENHLKLEKFGRCYDYHIFENINGKNVYFTHGHRYNIENIPYDDFEILIYGHIHQGFIQRKEGFIFANPGSISLPKSDDSRSFIILDEKSIQRFDLLNGCLLEEIIF